MISCLEILNLEIYATISEEIHVAVEISESRSILFCPAGADKTVSIGTVGIMKPGVEFAVKDPSALRVIEHPRRTETTDIYDSVIVFAACKKCCTTTHGITCDADVRGCIHLGRYLS